jgi:HEAT repeat protein
MEDDLSSLINELLEPSTQRRIEAATRLAKLGRQAKAAAVPLVRAAGDPQEDVRQWASAALEELGPPAAEDGPALVELLADARDSAASAASAASADVGYWAATLLGRLGSGAHTDSLAQALDPRYALAVRQRVCWALGEIGPAARSALDAIETASRSDDPRLARLAHAALARIGK